MQCEITAIFTYPVKSCRGSSMAQAELSELGIEGDRQLMILREGTFVNQKQLPQLACISVFRSSTSEIELSAEGHPTHRHQVESTGQQSEANLYGSKIAVVHQGRALADWLSGVTGEPLELVAAVSVFSRNLPQPVLAGLDGLNHTGFVDLAPVLLTSESSLADLNSRLPSPIPIARFRPNIVVRGLDAWAEDDIPEYRSGEITLQRQAHCERCAVTCTDQLTGERFGEPLRSLKSFRKTEDAYSSGILFGEYLSIIGQGTLTVGDRLSI
ncbi:MAG: hypothetical protein ACJASY_004191 [Halioglobus sp.]|jgi:uncharacterized protein YcbX